MLMEKDTRNHNPTCINDLSRRAQNNVQMRIFLEKSLIDEGHIKIVEEADNYHANGIAIDTIYFKLLTSKVVVDT